MADTPPRQLQAILDVLGTKWESLFEPSNGGVVAGSKAEKVLTWLYRILDTLDNKTGHLLRFTALLLTAQTFLAGIVVRSVENMQKAHASSPNISLVVLLLLLVPLVPPVAGLPVFWVKWKFLDFVQGKGASNAKLEDRLKEELWQLAEYCDKRVKFHQRTLYGCYICVASFIATLTLAVVLVI